MSAGQTVGRIISQGCGFERGLDIGEPREVAAATEAGEMWTEALKRFFRPVRQ